MTAPAAPLHLAPSPAWETWSGNRGLAASIQVVRDPGALAPGSVVLIGLPDDLGVRLNGGRRGADQGPTALRRALSRYGTPDPPSPGWPPVLDVGDVLPSGELEETHERVTAVVSRLLARGCLPVGMGGGHDLTLPLVRALAGSLAASRIPAAGTPRLTGIYLDAHLDVREAVGSGMAFRRILEELAPVDLHVRGLDPMVNARAHLDWFRSRRGRTDGFGAGDPWPPGPLFLSLDLDVLDQAFAPGVSAPNPVGWTPERVEAWVARAGAEPGVRLFDIMELSPRWDPDGRTARLAARMLAAFLRGVARRPAGWEGAHDR